MSEERYLAKLSELVLVHSVVFSAMLSVVLRIAFQLETVWLSARQLTHPSCGVVRRRAMQFPVVWALAIKKSLDQFLLRPVPVHDRPISIGIGS